VWDLSCWTLAELLAPRVQERKDKFSAILLRFENDLYLGIEGSGSHLLRSFVVLRFALFKGIDGAVMTLPMTEAVRHISGLRGYRSVTNVGLLKSRTKRNPMAATRLEELKSMLGVKSGWMDISAAIRPEQLHAGAPMWSARAEFIVEGERHRFWQKEDHSGFARKILGSLDDIRRLLLDSIAPSPVGP
jgi:hypothetical protein